jgi:hypothetical protein
VAVALADLKNNFPYIQDQIIIMKLILSLLLLLFIGSCLCAQPVSQGVKKIRLSPGKWPAGKTSQPVAAISVIQARPDSITIGYIQAEKGNETYQLVPEQQHGNWLDSLIQQRYSSSFSAGGRHLLWMIRDLSVTNDTATTYYFIHLKANVYTRMSLKVDHPLLTLDTALSGRLVDNNSYVTGITDILDVLYSSSLRATPEMVAADELQEDSLLLVTKSTVPILKDSIFHRGIYTSFSEFTANAPSVSGPVWARPDTTLPGAVRLFTMEKDSSVREVKAAWGICLGGRELYKYYNGRLIPIEKSGNGFVLSRYQDPVVRKNQAIYWRRLAADGWPDDSNPFSRKQMMTVNLKKVSGGPSAGPEPVATAIDMSSGEFKF